MNSPNLPKVSIDAPCPCGSEHTFSECCLPIHQGEIAKTALNLMKSRYSAFVAENEAYLLKSWHPDMRPTKIEFDHDAKWLGLKIKNTEKGTSGDDEGWVHFIARYKVNGKAHRIEENSYFCKIGENWVYHSAA